MTETELWDWMMAGNYPEGYPDMDNLELVSLDRRAFATLSADVMYRMEVKRKVLTPRMKREGLTTREVTKTLRKGSKVKVVMASRMGDVGITPNLDAHIGYRVRIVCTDTSITFAGKEIPLSPEGILIDIEPIEDPRSDKVKIAFPDAS